MTVLCLNSIRQQISCIQLEQRRLASVTAAQRLRQTGNLTQLARAIRQTWLAKQSSRVVMAQRRRQTCKVKLL